MQRHQRMPSWGFSAGFHQLKLEHWIRCCLECLKVSIRVPQSTAPSSKQSHHFSALLPPIVAAVVLLFDGVRWNLLAAIQLKSFWVQRGLSGHFHQQLIWFTPGRTEPDILHNLRHPLFSFMVGGPSESRASHKESESRYLQFDHNEVWKETFPTSMPSILH